MMVSKEFQKKSYQRRPVSRTH